MLLIFLEYVVSVLILRAFLNGMYLSFLLVYYRIFPIVMLVVAIIRTVYSTDSFVEYVIQIFTYGLSCIMILVMLIINIAFYGKDGYAYDR